MKFDILEPDFLTDKFNALMFLSNVLSAPAHALTYRQGNMTFAKSFV